MEAKASVTSKSSGGTYIHTIEWHMMNKNKFFPLSILSSFSVRCFIYPFTVIKTRIQLQRHSQIYSGTLDAFMKIYKYEGISGLYKGFWVSAFQVISGIAYITTYENVRHILQRQKLTDSSRIRALVGGGCASLVSQTIVVPFDVISQHVMVLGQLKGAGNKVAVINPLELDYLISSIAPKGTSTLMLQCLAAPLSGISATFITNPLDTVRARLQVQRSDGFLKTFHVLYEEEHLRIFFKGLSPRLIQSIFFSFMVILGYESVKRFSISDEFKSSVTW